MTLAELMNTGDPREIKRATAVKMSLCGHSRAEIAKVLDIGEDFVSKWKAAYMREGVDALLLGYKGSEGYLTDMEREEIISYIKQHKTISVDELSAYIKKIYGVVYSSRQSYYDLLHEAGMSWKKNGYMNPKKDDELVEKKRQEIEAVLLEKKPEIDSGEVVVWMEDECHLLWGDTCGYVWSLIGKKVCVPMTNERKKQTFYGAVNYHTKEFEVMDYDTANSENTIKFIEHLRVKSCYNKIIIIWDGASYHQFKGIPDYLKQVNAGLDRNDWKVTLILFAPYAPQQNPVEDIWLQGKNYLRRQFNFNETFEDVVSSFLNFFDVTDFNFPKLSLYGDL